MPATSSTTRPHFLTLSVDDAARLALVATRRGMHVADFLSWLVRSWLHGPGRTEVAAAAAGDTLAPVGTRSRRTRSPGAGQLHLVDDAALDPPPF